MKRIRTIIRISVLLSLALSSCITTSRVNFQVLTPAKYLIPAPIVKISLADNSNLVNGRFFLQIKQGDELKSKVKLDSSLSRALIFGNIEMLFNSPRFDVNEKYRYFKSKTFSQRFDLIDWTQIKSICNKDTSDALIALEYFTVNDSGSKNVTYNPNEGFYQGSIQMAVYSLWRIYYPYANNLYTDIVIRDTMTWVKAGWSSADVAMELPDRDYALEQACFKTGKKFGKTIAQQWLQVDRFIYISGNAEMRFAADLVTEKKWKEAVENWLTSFPEYKENKKLGSAIAYNLSVGYEVLDDIDKALEWAAKSYYIDPKPELVQRIQTLEKRKADKDLILEQLSQ